MYYHTCAMCPTSVVKRISPVRTLFPYHHLVSDEALPHIRHLYQYKNIKQFTADIDFLVKHFRPVAAGDIADAVQHHKPLPKHSFLLTFDDGFREAYDIIAPILLQKGIPAVFFINPAFVDNKEIFYRCKISLLIDEIIKTGQQNSLPLYSDILQKSISSFDILKAELKKINFANQYVLDDMAGALHYSYKDYWQKQQPFLTTVQIKSLHQQGFAIGAHSWDHPYYELLNQEQQLWQTAASLKYIRDTIPASYSYFSFPHTDALLPQSFFNRLKADCKIDLLFGIQNGKEEYHNCMVHRFNAERPEVKIKSGVNGILLYMALQKILGRHKIERI